MILCSKCSAELQEGMNFCNKCGSAVARTDTCQNCGRGTDRAFAFCQYCGAQKAADAPAAETVTINYNEVRPKRKVPKIAIISTAIVLVTALVATVIFTGLFSGSSSVPMSLLYVKDNQISYTSLKTIKPVEVTERLYSSGQISTVTARSLGNYIFISEDGKRIFYPDRTVENSGGIALYYKNLRANDPEGIKIDSEIKYYLINKKADRVFYIKGSENNLYINNLTDKEKIDSDVYSFYINENGSKIVYSNKEGSIYIKDGSKDKEKIDSDSNIVYASEDLNKLYYLKDKSLYIKKAGKEKEKIASDVMGVVKIYESGEIYYIKYDEEQLKLSDIVDDDMKAADENIKEPVQPKYPSSSDFVTWDEYYAARDEYYELNDIYQNEYNIYIQKLRRDNLRELLPQETVSIMYRTLYYYNNKESVVVTENLYTHFGCNSDKAVIIYKTQRKSEYAKIKMSTNPSFYEVQSLASQSYSSASDEVYAAVKAKSSVIEQENGNDFRINNSATAIYFMEYYDNEQSYGDLMEVKISNDSLEKAVKYDSDVFRYVFIKDSDTFYYFKDVKDYVGDLYMNKAKIDWDVFIGKVSYIDSTDTILYYTDYSRVEYSGTLKMYKGKEAIKIADDVHDFYAVSDKCIAFLTDYNTDSSKGDVYLYNGSKNKVKIDEDVMVIIPAYKSNKRVDIYDVIPYS
ncbi:MAG: hypothetical protein CVU97_02425 [Firmicutes bacterium HGW-Firmicutes-21]|nr:MAG: hypothetical protein CVU97_02425 [Firmicutes bacterium HGW-Firmicutes-21]